METNMFIFAHFDSKVTYQLVQKHSKQMNVITKPISMAIKNS